MFFCKVGTKCLLFMRLPPFFAVVSCGDGGNFFGEPRYDPTSHISALIFREICLNAEKFMGAGEEERFPMIQQLRSMTRDLHPLGAKITL